jgi:uncharacterized protein (TIGR03086 family)
MTVLHDLGPAAGQMAKLLDGVTDDQLAGPTPCSETTLGELIAHVGGLSQTFAAAAAKDLGPATAQNPSAQRPRLVQGWRTRIPEQLGALVEAWRRPQAWEGMTQAGGMDLPAQLAGKIALNELVIHGWDVARASGQPFDCDPQALEVSMEFVSLMSASGEAAGREGLFGPVVDVPAEAPLLDRVIGLSGRDPLWQPT